MSNRKRVPVTGGARFSGAHLCERLLGRGGDVHGVDNFFSSSRRPLGRPLASPRKDWMPVGDDMGSVIIGSPDEFAIGELSQIVIELTGTKSNTRLARLPCDGPRQRRANIAKDKEFRRWQPKTQLRDGSVKTIVYFDRPSVRG